MPEADPRDALARWGRRFYERGWMWGTAGNLSAHAEEGGFWVTASGVPKGDLERTGFLRVDPAGSVLEAPEGRCPSAETSLHHAAYRLDPAARACLHVHTVAANLLTRLHPADVPLPPIEMVKGLGIWEEAPRVAVAVVDNPLHVPDIAATVLARFPDGPPRVPAFLIRDHGMTVWGPNIEAAAGRVECLAYLLDYALEAHKAGAVWWPTDVGC